MCNAIEAMEVSLPCDLTISAAMVDKGAVAISIIDTGPEIAPEVADRLYQTFVTTKAQGMGVSLSICRSIIEAQNGRLWAKPNPPGHNLPLHRSRSPVEQPPTGALSANLPIPPPFRLL
jgi:two-component system sensor kinase FixL